jgi:two-component system cell cycle sensor histidine kinase/response regulator CckA
MLLGANWFDRVVAPADRDRVRTVFREAVERGFTVPQFDNAIVTRSGETRHVHWTNTILKDPDGRFVGVASVGVDVTDRIRLEEQLHDTQRMESLGRLSSAVAHDFNNLLTVVFGSVQLARMATEPREVTEHLDLIQETAAHAAELTSQLLSFARKRPVKPQTVEFNRVLTECERMVRRMVTDQTRIALSLAPDAGYAWLDPGQMQQVFVNLVVNARDAMPLGGTITIESRRVTMPGDAAWGHDGLPSGDWAALRVRDEGPGIDPVVRDRLFEPFFTTKAPGKGTGLGLATCYGIVSAAGGHILVDSGPGRGTSFCVYFPRHAEATGAAAEQTPWRTPPGGTARVLIVESDQVVRDLTREILAAHGYAVSAAASSDEALRLVGEGERFDLLVTELLMPLVDGATLARRVRASQPEVKVILVSGYVTESGEPSLAVGAGATFLAKPFTPEQLLWTIAGVV